MKTVPADRLAEHVGTELGPSDWFEVTQERVSSFADVTLDHQFIHVDPGAAAATPFGGTIAHGFLTLSLLVHLAGPLQVVPEGMVMGINYGTDKVRFVNPVRVGKRIRARSRLVDVVEKSPGQYLFTYDVTVDIEGEAKPALVAEWLSLAVVA